MTRAKTKSETLAMFSEPTIASFRYQTLHRAIAESVIDGLTNGVEMQLVDGLTENAARFRPEAIRETRRRELTTELQTRRAQASRARRRAIDLDDDELANDLLQDAKEHLRQARGLEQKLTELDADSLPAATTAIADKVTVLETNADYVIAAMATLGNTEKRVDANTASAIQTVVETLTLHPTLRTVEGSCTVLLPTSAGVVRAGPFQFSIPNRSFHMNLLLGDFNTRLAEHFVAAGIPAGSRLALERALLGRGLCARNAAIAARAPLTVLADALGFALGLCDAPVDVDPAWLDLVTNTYLGEKLRWRKDEWARDATTQQRIISWLERCGEPQATTDCEKMLIEAGEKPRAYDHAVRRSMKLHPERRAPVARAGQWGSGNDRELQRITLHACPHCSEPITLAIFVPELHTGLLCRHCLRTPDLGSPRFPAEYLRVEAADL